MSPIFIQVAVGYFCSFKEIDDVSCDAISVRIALKELEINNVSTFLLVPALKLTPKIQNAFVVSLSIVIIFRILLFIVNVTVTFVFILDLMKLHLACVALESKSQHQYNIHQRKVVSIFWCSTKLSQFVSMRFLSLKTISLSAALRIWKIRVSLLVNSQLLG